ncbi:MAG: hypothetical protein ACPL7D_01175 [Candidatus Sumerlaeaceae bacterium]|jgi:hypothetical protein
MPYENIRVTVTKRGQIEICIDGADEQRLRDFRVFLEEVLGPISHFVKFEPPPWERDVKLAGTRTQELQQGREQG